MNGPEEHAAGSRSGGTFPPEWGFPQGRPGSEERTAWIRRNVERHAGTAAMRKLRARDIRLLADLRVAEVKAREKGPLS